MFYILTILIPLVIILIPQISNYNKGFTFIRVINSLIISIPFLMVYMFIIYNLEKEGSLNTGWVYYSLLFFFIPYVVILLLIKIIHFLFFRNRQNNNVISKGSRD